MSELTDLTPMQQADQIRQVVGVLSRLEQRLDAAGDAGTGRSSDDCLVSGIDAATRWTIPGVSEEVIELLVVHLPAPFQVLARARPRLALALYDETIGGRRGALRLVRRALDELGVKRRTWRVFAPAEGEEAATSQGSKPGARDRIIDVRQPTFWVS